LANLLNLLKQFLPKAKSQNYSECCISSSSKLGSKLPVCLIALHFVNNYFFYLLKSETLLT